MPFELDISTFRPDRPGIRKVLGDLEAEIINKNDFDGSHFSKSKMAAT